uniref:Uncharacterized protein n=1 Tax=Anguilla anguilla TaxID=7936 RepID=A0A0E9STE6_ANGAN
MALPVTLHWSESANL